MNNCIDFDFCGKPRPLCFTVHASDIIGQRCGGIEKLEELFDAKDVSTSLANTCWLLWVLMSEGEKNAQLCATYSGDEREPLAVPSEKELLSMLPMAELLNMNNILLGVMTVSSNQTVEVEDSKKGKNGGTTQ